MVVHLEELKTKEYTYTIEQARADFFKLCTSVSIQNKDIDISSIRSQVVNQKMSLWRKKTSDLVQREIYDISFTDIERMLAFIEKADKPYIKDIYFGELSHTEMTKFRKEVKIEAAQMAIEKAKYLAKASGKEVKSTLYIEELADSFKNTVNPYANTISYKKQSLGGNANVSFGFKPIIIHYEVLIICELN